MTRRISYKPQRFCQRCIIQNTRGCSKLCVDCRAAGWRWCTVCGPCQLDNYAGGRRNLCLKHHCERTGRYNMRRQYGAVIDPPPGYIDIGKAAKLIGVSYEIISKWRRHGGIKGWQRRPGGRWYVEVTR
jgi:hypothetical protein